MTPGWMREQTLAVRPTVFFMGMSALLAVPLVLVGTQVEIAVLVGVAFGGLSAAVAWYQNK